VNPEKSKTMCIAFNCKKKEKLSNIKLNGDVLSTSLERQGEISGIHTDKRLFLIQCCVRKESGLHIKGVQSKSPEVKLKLCGCTTLHYMVPTDGSSLQNRLKSLRRHGM
jgi:hypothetical protein